MTYHYHSYVLSTTTTTTYCVLPGMDVVRGDDRSQLVLPPRVIANARIAGITNVDAFFFSATLPARPGTIELRKPKRAKYQIVGR